MVIIFKEETVWRFTVIFPGDRRTVVKNRKISVCLMIYYSRRSVFVDNLACVLGVILPVTEPTNKLQRFCNIFKFVLDRRIVFAYTMYEAVARYRTSRQLEPGTLKKRYGFFFMVL